MVLSGGSTLLPGSGARLQREIKSFDLMEELNGGPARMAWCPLRVKETAMEAAYGKRGRLPPCRAVAGSSRKVVVTER
ncbi:actin-related protein 2, putative [Leishmania tarentolae]|uniref:Actin-related protein 2, putative n=1 Tax=Leishmania tarentolae TaxID=5689 RepID=A0A640KKP5_LEITA|nr:actin-related protein 2, putative [Leishmania tarentolae]